METMKGLHRTHGCGTISEAEVGKEVVLCGWVERRRDHGGVAFIDLRDNTGLVQVVIYDEEWRVRCAPSS